MPPRVILASASPRRQQFFQALGIPFSIQPADIEEAPAPGETPISMVERLAAAKALSVGDRLMKEGCGRDERKYSDDNAPASHSIQIIVGADTVVALDGESLGKPQSADEARTMLQRLRGRNHYVHTAVAAVRFAGASPQAACCVVNSTIVTMRAYSDSEIETTYPPVLLRTRPAPTPSRTSVSVPWKASQAAPQASWACPRPIFSAYCQSLALLSEVSCIRSAVHKPDFAVAVRQNPLRRADSRRLPN